MTIRDIVLNTDTLSEDVVVYARKVNGSFEGSSEIELLELPDEDLDLPTKDVSEKYCPGFDYFLEGSIIKELLEDIRTLPEYQAVDQQVKRVIYYAEFDA